MGGRGLVARLSATARGFLIAGLVAGFAFVVRAETQPAEVAATSSNGVEPAAAPGEAEPYLSISGAREPSDDGLSASPEPASSAEDEPPASAAQALSLIHI